MTLIGDIPQPHPLRAIVQVATRADETLTVQALLAEADLGGPMRERITVRAAAFVERMRSEAASRGGLDAFMREYDLSSEEGVLLMCLAEALLRVPDAETADRLIADKIGDAHWQKHLGHSQSLFVNASTWALMLTGRVVRLEESQVRDAWSFLRRMVARSGEPVIRQAMIRAMRIMGRQFVMGRTISEALERARGDEARGYLHSYDMLGEAALTAADAERYYGSYRDAIAAVGRASAGRGPIDGPGISIKLSALHPRFEYAQRERLMAELAPRVRDLARRAREAGIGLCVDTEEADRLDVTLDVFEAVFTDPALSGWEGFGLAIQAYQKRTAPLISWLADLARAQRRRMSVRLVKGAYWDTEIKAAQEQGLDGYPVFTRKVNTDVSYIVCARRILAAPDAFYPQFATHNAHTLATVLELAGDRGDFECQRLHGMGEDLFDQIVRQRGQTGKVTGNDGGVRCRIYAPVGSHEDLLAYLVRRLLENGANSSFVNRLADERLPIEAIVADPAVEADRLRVKTHPRIPKPRDLFLPERLVARGVDLADPADLRSLSRSLDAVEGPWRATPVVGGTDSGGRPARPVTDPADRRRVVGEVVEAVPGSVERAIEIAAAAAPGWNGTPAAERAACLERAATLLEDAMSELMMLAVREAGKTLPDALAEVREAVDFLRYYAARARADFAEPLVLPGPTGESNHLALHGRGVFACISPWNFPLAIFCGQVSAALAAGNAVVAKPAEQTPLIAARAVAFLHEAGIPAEVLHLVPGDGAIGAALVEDGRINGVAFTGSVETAHAINRSLARRDGPIVPLIAETGGQNAMLVDSTALPEQVVTDAVTSAFRSAGQRCSALRVLFVQRDIAPRIMAMLAGAMAELRVGDPGRLATDVGPVIDDDALQALAGHAQRMGREGRLINLTPLTDDCGHGSFFAPRAYEIDRIDRLEREVFGPILHVIPYAASHLDQVLDAINGTGYGLTLGIHTRVDDFADTVHRHLRVGNTYVNCKMIGAVVGVQPFGGEGLSGTGPKAGGPRYLHRFACERTLTVNTAATGGNAVLLSLGDDDG
ncbi:MAG: bifunctional proline dehydrogenase/L-glutamate gamma-semialdehyde dehydrogenase PutA [Rhodospirillales bacterium]|nr:bifunctional proline dehydrogenase/L-glutamate gamma-semialdehyde dehydrogenase PutA [Rhodospirillales bacterium]